MNHLYSYIKRDNRGNSLPFHYKAFLILTQKLKGNLHLHRGCIEKVAKSVHCAEPKFLKAAGKQFPAAFLFARLYGLVLMQFEASSSEFSL
jgi:hypothetical protein